MTFINNKRQNCLYLDSIEALETAGLWPNGIPIRLFSVQENSKVIEEINVECAIHNMSEKFGNISDIMAEKQIEWYHSLNRPNNNADTVMSCLEKCLQICELNWKIKRFHSIKNLWDKRIQWISNDKKSVHLQWWFGSIIANLPKLDCPEWKVRSWSETGTIAFDAKCAKLALTALFFTNIEYKLERFVTEMCQSYRNGLKMTIPTGQNELGFIMCK
jgi:hypothetical protein